MAAARTTLSLLIGATLTAGQVTPGYLLPNSQYPSGVVPNPVSSAGGFVTDNTQYPVGSFLSGSYGSTNAQASSGVQGYFLVNPPAAPLANILGSSTSNQCAYIEGAFEDGFQLPVFNTSRWQAPVTSLDHCPTPGAVGAANAATCTAMLPSMLTPAVQLPAYPTGDIGLIMTLSQKPCATPGACCNARGTICANWAGAHLTSNGCIHYGVLETEAAFNIPPSNGGVGFFGTYMYGGAPDPSWNEIDQTFINGASGLEFHASLFLSNPGAASNAQEDKDVFDASGLNCNSYVPPAKTPGNIKGTFTPYVCPKMTTQLAAQYHTYKLIWTPTWLAWTVDNVVYRNSSAAPWRPVTMRPLLRTNVGTSSSSAVLPDAQIYVRRIRYTPLTPAPGGFLPSWQDPVVNAALSCVSMTACYGSMAGSAAGLVQMAAGGSTPGVSAGRRRHLLQSQAPQLNCVGTVCTPVTTPGAPAAFSAYLTELATATAAAQKSISQTLADGNSTILPSQISVSITSHTVSGVMLIFGIPFAAWNTQVQNAFVIGLANDVVPTPDQVYVTSVTDASLPSSWCTWNNTATCGTPTTYDPLVAGRVQSTAFSATCNGATTSGCSTAPFTGVAPGGSANGGAVSLTGLQGVLVSYIVDGYSCALYSGANATSCTDGGYSIAQSDASLLNSIQFGVNGAGGSATYQTLYTAFSSFSPSYSAAHMGVLDESPGTIGAQGAPSIAYVAAVNIAVFTSPLAAAVAGSSRTDILEALFDSAVNSGSLAQALAASNYSATPPTNVQVVRATRQADNLGGCPITTANNAAAISAVTAAEKDTRKWTIIAVVFIVALGMGILGLVAGVLVLHLHHRKAAALASRYASRDSGKIPSFSKEDAPDAFALPSNDAAQARAAYLEQQVALLRAQNNDLYRKTASIDEAKARLTAALSLPPLQTAAAVQSVLADMDKSASTPKAR